MANYLEDLSGVLHGVAMDNYFEHLSGVLQSFGAAGIVLLVVPVLITVLARDVPGYCIPACFPWPRSCFLLPLLLQSVL